MKTKKSVPVTGDELQPEVSFHAGIAANLALYYGRDKESFLETCALCWDVAAEVSERGDGVQVNPKRR